MLSRSSNWINVLEAAKGFRNGIRAIGVPKFAAVDKQAVLETLAHGGGHINLVQGGLQVLNETGQDGWLIANPIIVVSIETGNIQ